MLNDRIVPSKIMQSTRTFCFLSPAFFLEAMGGSEMQNWYIAQELVKRGWKVHYIREASEHAVSERVIDNVTLHSIPRRHAYLKFLNIFHIIRMAEDIRPSVWYVRGDSSYVFPATICAKIHGGVTIWHCSHEMQLRKQSEILRNVKCVWIPFALFNFYLFKKSLSRVNYRILQTTVQKTLLSLNMNLDGEVIYNVHPRPRIPTNERRPIVLFVGNLKPLKRPDLFLDIARKLQEKNYHFIMIGRPDNKALLEKVRKAEKEIENFTYLGERPIGYVNDLMSRSSLLVCTSEQEGFPNVFIEAWIHGMPVVSIFVDPDNIIRDHGLGTISHTVERAVTDIRCFMDNRERWVKCSEKCLGFSHRHFNVARAVDTIEAMLFHHP